MGDFGDDPLRELLSSPLEPGRRRRDRDPSSEDLKPGRPRFELWFAGAVLAGGIVVLGGYVIARSPAPPAMTVAPSTSTSTTLVTEPLGALPAGYVPVGTRLGMKVERILARSDAVFVSLSSVVPNTLAPAESSGFQGGLWSLVLADDRRVASVVESTDAGAPGFVTVQFPADGYVPTDIVAIELQAVAHRAEQDVEASTDSFTLPSDGAMLTIGLSPQRFALDAGVDLVLSDLTLSTTGGVLTWSLEGSDGDARATVYPYLEVGPQVAVSRIDHSVFGFFFAQSISPLPMEREGGVVFEPPDTGPGAAFASDQSVTALLQASVAWAVYSPERATIPIGDDVVIAQVG